MGRKSEKFSKKKKVEGDCEKEESDTQQTEESEKAKSEDINKNEKPPKKNSRSVSPAEESNGNEAEDEGSNDEGNSTSPENKENEVEKIVGERMRNGKKQYKIRWVGFSSKEDTWEWEDKTNDYSDKVKEYEESKTEDKEQESQESGSSASDAPTKKNKRKANEEKNKRLPKKKRKELKDEGSESEEDTPSGSQTQNNGSSPVEYEVIKIVGEREIKGRLEYKVRWKGYKPKDDTWEIESHLNCPDLLKKYHASKKTPKAASASKNGEWEISKIIEMQTSKDGNKTFRVRWKGFTANDDTWEPEENLKDKQIFQTFIAKLEKNKDTKRELRTKRPSTKRLSYTPQNKKRKGAKGRKH